MDIPKLQPGDIIELYGNEELRYFCNDNVEQFDDIVHPDEDEEFYVEQISRVWRLEEDTYICIYKRERY